MEISIITMTGRTLTLTVQPHSTVASLKLLIQQKEGVPVSKQRLVYENGNRTTLTEDTQTLSYYGLQSGSRVALAVVEPVIKPPQRMEVFLKNEKGVSSTYEVNPDETVSDFKRKVECNESVPVSQQRLVFEGREMSGGKLTDYGVQTHSTIYLCLRLRGG